MLQDLVRKNRSYRRFDASRTISMDELKSLVVLARETNSSVNSQSLRFRPVNEPERCAKIFDTLGWAGLLPDWPGPSLEERPTAYILILVPKELQAARNTDVGIAAEVMLLGAVEMGLGGCMLGNVRRTEALKAEGIDPEIWSLPLVVALGKPHEDVRIVDVQDGDTRYYRDAQGVHYVPKFSLNELIL